MNNCLEMAGEGEVLGGQVHELSGSNLQGMFTRMFAPSKQDIQGVINPSSERPLKLTRTLLDKTSHDVYTPENLGLEPKDCWF